ncbi:MAG TPA: HAD family hydrolase [Pseudonocardiaceae bacterium]|nr:HAD family hydrolase [Pseudonocardiaceae bacterium]
MRAVCLDVDDTLVDCSHSALAGLTELIGPDEGWRCYSRWFELTEQHHGRFIDGEIDFHTMRLQRTRAFLAELGEMLSDAEVADREARRAAAMRRAWCLYDDVAPCLHLLRSAGVMLAVITNAAGPHQRGKLAAVGLVDAFDLVVIADEVGVAKPDARIFRLACHRLRIAPHQAVHVGDRLDVDAVAASEAGLNGVWLDRSLSGTPAPAGVHVINQLTELPGLVAGLAA